MTLDIVALITAGTALISALAGWFIKSAESKRNHHETEDKTALDGYEKLCAALQKRLDVVENKLALAQQEIAALQVENAKLAAQVATLTALPTR